MGILIGLIAAAIVIVCAALFLIAPRRRPPALLDQLCRYRYAHRGYHDSSAGIPENSMAAFRRAAAHGFGAELDVHLSRDGRLVVMHDESLLRTCGVNQEISDLTAAELSQFRLEGTDELIPDLEQVLALAEQEKMPLIIEVKPVRRNHAALCAAVVAMLDRFSVDCCLESFDPRAVYWLRRHRPELVRGQLTENYSRHGEQLSAPTRFVLHQLLTNFLTRPDFIACRVEDRGDFAVRLCCGLLHAQEFGWTIRTPEEQCAVEHSGGVIIFEHFDPSKMKV